MNLIPWRRTQGLPAGRESTFSAPLAEFRSEMDRLFDRFFRRGPLAEASDWFEDTGSPIQELMPRIDLAENDRHITIRAEIPGLDPDDIDINVSGNVLTIHGEKKESSEDRRDDFYYRERRFGSFTRSVELPSTADLDDVVAEQSNGVLTVRVKRVPTAKVKKIDVKSTKRTFAGAPR